MQDERVGLDHVHGAATFVDRIAVVELHRAEVGKEQQIGRHGTHTKGLAQLTRFDAGALAADAHGQVLSPVPLRPGCG